MDDTIKATQHGRTELGQLPAAPKERRPDTVYLAILGEKGNEYVSVVFYSHARAMKWLNEKRQNPSIVAKLDAVNCADGDALRVP